MAQRVDKELGQSRSIYPWDEWLDGSTWRLVAGEDFHIIRTHFVSQVYKAAKVRKCRAIVHASRWEPGVVYLQRKSGGLEQS